MSPSMTLPNTTAPAQGVPALTLLKHLEHSWNSWNFIVSATSFQSIGKCIEWKPNEVSIETDGSEQEWALVNTSKPASTSSVYNKYPYERPPEERAFNQEDKRQPTVVDGQKSDGLSDYQVVERRDQLPPRVLSPRGPPLSFHQWCNAMNTEGRITDPDAIKKIIFDGVRQKDVNRTDRSIPFFEGDDNPNLKLLYDVLMTYVMYDFDLGYVQGMSDLLSPILSVMCNEVDAFWCFVGFMKKVFRNFDMDQSGMKKQLSQLHTLLSAVQPELSTFLDEHESGNMFFCFRWLLVWFKREFQHEEIMELWEHVNDLALNLNLHDVLATAASIFTQLESSPNLTTATRRVLGLMANEAATNSSTSDDDSIISEGLHCAVERSASDECDRDPSPRPITAMPKADFSSVLCLFRDENPSFHELKRIRVMLMNHFLRHVPWSGEMTKNLNGYAALVTGPDYLMQSLRKDEQVFDGVIDIAGFVSC
ncbi:unnamed protein product [Nesidiocoris tenuis]|uniref:Rab-GAP TBC domain-containing protein n=1 Tax=Nesidiocoris tenuis TaxID=355587 RepID=A0A6H5HQM7_9HEMI|nr:unnamed protein product [Nesidiocoris tenuis]